MLNLYVFRILEDVREFTANWIRTYMNIALTRLCREQLLASITNPLQKNPCSRCPRDEEAYTLRTGLPVLESNDILNKYQPA